MKKYDYPAVKTGYVGKIFLVVNFMMVKRWWVTFLWPDVLQIIKWCWIPLIHPTGYSRTYQYIAADLPEEMSSMLGCWNPPMHETILPFTRLLGPMDYTPGILK
jgi:hypothetical protein